MTSLTLITLAVVAYGLLNKHGFGRALALGGATAAGSAVYLGGVAVPTFYAVALVALALLVARACISRPRAQPRVARPDLVVVLLACFLVWAVLITILAPFLFPGTPVVAPAKSELNPGMLSSSNVAQMVYLFLGLVVVVFLRNSKGGVPELIGIATGTCTLLSAWRYLSQVTGLPFPEGVFDNSPSFAYIETAAGGLARFRGILSEPAGLASNCLVTIFYMIPRSQQVSGWRRIGCLALAGAAAYMGIISTSTTFVIAGVAGLAVVLAATGFGFLSRRVSFSRPVSLSAAVAAIILVWALPKLYTFVAEAVHGKLASSSYTARSMSNRETLDAFFNSFGLGIGVGSVRASSFIPTLIGATGILGALLFWAMIVIAVARYWGSRQYRPVVWALIIFLIIKVASGPDLSDSGGVLWISVGLLSRPKRSSNEGDESDSVAKDSFYPNAPAWGAKRPETQPLPLGQS